MMKINLKPYVPTDAATIDSWLDAETVALTGLDDGWSGFYDYWTTEAEMSPDESCHCFTLYSENKPVGVIFLGASGRKLTVMELIVAPSMRGKSIGSAALTLLLCDAESLLGKDFDEVEAVIFPNNTASRRCFEKSGFAHIATHPDGDAMYYSKKIVK